MDPDACFKAFLNACEGGDNVAEALESRRHLLDWLSRGGFEPNWSSAEREQFMSWLPSHNG